MARIQSGKMIYKILLPVSIFLTVALSLLVLVNLYSSNKTISALAERELNSLARQYGNEVAAFISVATNATNDMVSVTETMYAEHTPFSRSGLISLVRGFLKANKEFVGGGSGWEANAFDDNDIVFGNTTGSDGAGRFIPYLIGGGGVDILTDIEISDWYTVPKNEHKQIVTNPYMYKVGNKDVLMTTAASPVIVNGTFKGVITLDVTLDVIIDKISAISLYDSGYGFLITQNGTYITHPDESLIGKDYFGNDSKLALKKEALRRGEHFLDLRTISGEEPQYYLYSPIKLGSSGKFWYLVIAVPKAEVLAESRFISIVTIISALATLLLALTVIFLIVRSQIKPLAHMVEATTIIAHGNLQYQIDDAKFDGEMRQLSEAIKSMISSLIENINAAQTQTDAAKLKGEEARIALDNAYKAQTEMEAKRDVMLETAGELEGIASIITSAAQDISSQIEQASRGAHEQASRIAVTAKAVDNMNMALLDVARNATASAELSINSKNEAMDGAQLTEQCKAGINDVRADSLTLKDGMVDLSRHAQDINDIMGVISDIADQTNLLALNAAIEAARAGDAGRGFAVVADEVRKLAEKTMTSTTDVGNAIRAIQQSSETSAKHVDVAVEKIQGVTGIAEQCGNSLNRIVSMIDQAANEVRSIATTSDEQSVSSGEIASSVSQVNVIAEETLQVMQESSLAVAQLTQQARELSILIERMKKV